MEIGVAIKDGQAFAVDLSSGRLVGKVGEKKARAASSNGQIIAVARDGYRIWLYKASNRQRIKAAGKKGAVSLDLHSDKLLVSYGDGTWEGFDLSLLLGRYIAPQARLQALANKQ